MTPTECQTSPLQSIFQQILTLLNSSLITHLSSNPIFDFPTDQICFTKALIPFKALLSRRLDLVLSVEPFSREDGSA